MSVSWCDAEELAKAALADLDLAGARHLRGQRAAAEAMGMAEEAIGLGQKLAVWGQSHRDPAAEHARHRQGWRARKRLHG